MTPTDPTTDRTGPGASPATVGQISALIAFQLLSILVFATLLYTKWPAATQEVSKPVAGSDTAATRIAGGSAADSARKRADSAATRTGVATAPTNGADTGRRSDSAVAQTGPANASQPSSPARDSAAGDKKASPSRAADSGGKVLTLTDQQAKSDSERAVFLIVIAAGALGALFRGMGSSTWYVGTRTLYRSWLPMYYVQPFKGAVLGLLFYFVFRTGLTSTNPAVPSNAAGFAALAALVGMFEREATKKLQLVAEALFTKKDENIDKAPAADPKEPGAPAPGANGAARPAMPVITSTDPASIPAGTPGVRVKLRGSGFDQAAKVSVTSGIRPQARDVQPTGVTATDMYVTLDAADLQSPGLVTIAVANGPDAGAKSDPVKIAVK